MSRPRSIAVVAGLGTLGAAWWWRKNPSPCPYWQRFFVEAPHPWITRKRLLEVLDPRPGERILDLGPGTGYYSFDVAARLARGTLEIFDIQQEMLDHIMAEAAERGVTNIRPTQGDAQALSYEDESLDGAYLVTVLGEIPDSDRALRELRRVLKPGARLVVGELFGDPHMVSFRSLRERAERAGFDFERRLGNPLAFFARFRAT